MELENKAYTPKEIESKWYKFWESNEYFKPSMDTSKPAYCIQLPPPNVTGTLHMGHAFQQTIMDSLIRYHRMRGFNTLWQVGTDHAGIATQIVVERQLDAQGISRHDLGREKFLEKVWEWKEYSGGSITAQMRRLGTSCDWSRERFTMDQGLSNAVSKVFIDLYRKGTIYRGKRLVNWDVKLQTAVSDLEVVSEEENGSMWYIRYPLANGNGEIVVATTRPETMLGDVAVAVSAEDERYKHLIGESLVLPLVGRHILIIADEYVEASFGTGCVKITPAHDFNDYEVGKRHNLEMISIFDLQGMINDNAPSQYQGLERFAARKQIVKDLTEQGFLVEIKPHKLMVPRGDRTNVVIEPMLTDQWFMAMDSFAKVGLELVESGKIKFIPDNWKSTYDQWLTKVQDWCISRQLWWGHRIPAYYDEDGNIYVAATLAEAQAQAGSRNIVQDNDVLDTWFSSALWSFSTLGWPDKTEELDIFLPSNVLVTGFDIIFFWVARMIMMTSEFTGEVPFKDIYITGLVCDAQGDKMSKSKGNVIDPIDLIDGISVDDLLAKRTTNLMNPKQAETIAKHTRRDYPEGFTAFGADALRFTMAILATGGREIKFDVKRIEGSRNFANKIWNASRFVMMNIEGKHKLIGKPYTQTFIDSYIIDKLNSTIEAVNTGFATYRFDMAATAIYEFFWNEYCDWYVELAKVNLQSTDSNAVTATVNTLLQVLETALRLIHPFMPFITEELWQNVAELIKAKDKPSIMLSLYPETPLSCDTTQLQHVELFKELISKVRNLRAENGLAQAAKAPLVIEISDHNYLAIVNSFASFIKVLAKVTVVTLVEKFDKEDSAIAVLNQSIRLMLVVEIDVAAETIRLTREIEKNQKELDKMMVKLDNPSYKDRAPAHLVVQDEVRVAELGNVIAKLNEQLSRVKK